ncbi:MAG: ferritin-like domain-containing protein [Novosphingobium sp.]
MTAVQAGGNQGFQDRIGARLRDRYLEVVASIYLYNEHRGYTALDRVLEAARARCPGEAEFIEAVASHRADERKHYVMFKRWFERRGRMPLAVDRSCGHIDHFIQRVFGCKIDDLDTSAVIADGAAFERLCRVIMLTEQRGFAQVEVLLRNRMVLADPVMTRIFTIIHADEPSHFLPYRHWLERQGRARGKWNEKLADWSIHKLLMLVKLPTLFFNRGARRLADWPDAGEVAA